MSDDLFYNIPVEGLLKLGIATMFTTGSRNATMGDVLGTILSAEPPNMTLLREIQPTTKAHDSVVPALHLLQSYIEEQKPAPVPRVWVHVFILVGIAGMFVGLRFA